MQLSGLKSYKIFIAICVLFSITVCACVFLYIKYVSELDSETVEKEASLEITLPIIEWGKYESLSKKLGSDNIEK